MNTPQTIQTFLQKSLSSVTQNSVFSFVSYLSVKKSYLYRFSK
jgi:hypothetical protein